ncbi:MAG: hypothetical protein EAX96_17890 [Candidatus Lokiarchaeota archaeon]|nr:hypothetical protein [Candidatus Lokiarchaeota archaeon]
MKRILLYAPMEFVKKVGFGDVFEYVEEMELLRIFRFDMYDMITMQRFKLKNPHHHPKMVVGLSGIESIQVIQEDKEQGNYVILAKTHTTVGFDKMLKDFDFILDYPINIDQKGVKIPFISNQKKLKAVLEKVKKMIGNDFKVLNITSIKPNIETIHSLLTKKQKDIISFATKKGYFEIPRKITSKDISDYFDISTSAVNEHMRKIEKRIFNYLFVE